ncbi:helix-turn-helix domain-containing protein [Streptomyces sp. NPDC006879]|uniref:helix-turn-helix domain-containing protein n=1 Tax=Streptomyces sp. NPDC006879 TaxID=3364767 RepID=UPI00367AA36E
MSETGPGVGNAQVTVGRTDLGRRLAARRQELGLSREEVGERCGADGSYIAYLEEHAAAPAIGSLIRLADALGITVAELTGAASEYPAGRTAALQNTRLVKLSEGQCRRLLSTHGVGRIALFTREGPAIFPVNYVVAGKDIAFRTSEDALMATAAGTEVAFEIDRIDDALRTGWSVMAVGMVAGVTDAEELGRLSALAFSRPWAGGPRTHWMKIVTSRISGRRVVQR